jgi:hypothetical protein
VVDEAAKEIRGCRLRLPSPYRCSSFDVWNAGRERNCVAKDEDELEDEIRYNVPDALCSDA